MVEMEILGKAYAYTNLEIHEMHVCLLGELFPMDSQKKANKLINQGKKVTGFICEEDEIVAYPIAKLDLKEGLEIPDVWGNFLINPVLIINEGEWPSESNCDYPDFFTEERCYIFDVVRYQEDENLPNGLFPIKFKEKLIEMSKELTASWGEYANPYPGSIKII